MPAKRSTKSAPSEGLPRLVVGISGASGAIYGIRLLKALKPLAVETHLVISRAAELTIAYETDYKIPEVRALADASYATDALRLLHTQYRTSGPLVFPSKVHGRHLTDLDGHFAVLAKGFGYAISAHDLRRTYASNAHRAGVDGLTISRLLNQSPNSTARGAMPAESAQVPVVTRGYIRRHTDDLRSAQQPVSDRTFAVAEVGKMKPTPTRRKMIKRHVLREAVSA